MKPFLTLLFIIQLTFYAHTQTIFISGDIGINTTWSVDTVKITGNINILEDAVLTVEPGTYVELQGYYRIKVAGSIRALGSVTDSIIFTVLDTTGFWQDTYSVAGGWEGFMFKNAYSETDTSEFQYCRIQFGKKYLTNGDDIEGAAICANNYGCLIVKNSLLNFNMVINHEDYSIGGPIARGGAIFCSNVNSVVIHQNTFYKNRSFDEGGAIYIGSQCQSEIHNNTFLSNKAFNQRVISGVLVSWGNGAAIATNDTEEPSPVIADNFCFNNYAASSIIVIRSKRGLVYNNLICNNHGSGISAIHYFSKVRIFNNTIANNYSNEGGIFLYCDAKVYNNILWSNKRHSFEPMDQIMLMQGGGQFLPILSYNCVEHGNGGIGSISMNPQFVNPSQGIGLEYPGAEADWSLLESSPCINSGTPDTTGLYLPVYDLINNPRIYGIGIEMGAYENQQVIIGIDKVESTNTLIYPNPGTHKINIESSNRATYIEMTTITGQIILRKHFATQRLIIDAEFMAPGIYLYKLYNNNSELISSGKWIKTGQ